jgi:hypothetical protein
MLEVLMFGGQVSPSSLNPQLTRHYLHQRGDESPMVKRLTRL